MKEKKNNKITWQMVKKSPWWTWLFIVACIILPITTLGGAIPAVVAMIGIILCVKVSSLQTIKIPIKLLLCFSITGAA